MCHVTFNKLAFPGLANSRGSVEVYMSIACPLTFIYYFFIIDTLVSHSEELYRTYIPGIQRTDTSHLCTED